MKASERMGSIAQIQEYSLHDGDGIRTTVFFSGCPLRCRWCANPETWAQQGTSMTVKQVVDQVKRGAVFFRASGGGVAFSGGEAAAQPEFLNALVDAFDDLCIDMVLETSGYFDWSQMEPSLKKMSMVFVDIKHMDSAIHKRVTGTENALILENLRRLAGIGVPIVVRIPLIKDLNDSPENLRSTARFILEHCPSTPVELLPYHNYGVGKYRALGLEEPEFVVPNDKEVAAARAVMEEEGVRTVEYR